MKPTVYVTLASGRDAWIEVPLDQLQFEVTIENGKTTRETITLAELKRYYPTAAGVIAEVIAAAIRVRPAGGE